MLQRLHSNDQSFESAQSFSINNGGTVDCEVGASLDAETKMEDCEHQPNVIPKVPAHMIPSSRWHRCQIMATSTASCCLNMVFMEGLLQIAPKSINSISFVQHIFIVCVGLAKFGLPFGMFGSKPSSIPVHRYVPLVALNLIGLLTNNASINYGVSIPLNMIFRSSTLIANMVLGMLLMHHRYPITKYVSVLLITAGLITCIFEDYYTKFMKDELKSNSTSTLFNGTDVDVANLTQHSMSFISSALSTTPITTITTTTTTTTSAPRNFQAMQKKDVLSQTIGIVCITISLVLASGTGLYQEHLRDKFGKHADESMWYVHLLSLPFFTIYSYSELGEHWTSFTESTLNWIRPEMDTTEHDRALIVYLVLNVLTQYVCVRSVYTLTTECASLTVNLVITNRRFLSIIFSIFYFGNPFTWKHWIGTAVVFGGTGLFTLVDYRSSQKLLPNTAAKSGDSLQSTTTSLSTTSCSTSSDGDAEEGLEQCETKLMTTVA